MFVEGKTPVEQALHLLQLSVGKTHRSPVRLPVFVIREVQQAFRGNQQGIESGFQFQIFPSRGVQVKIFVAPTEGKIAVAG